MVIVIIAHRMYTTHLRLQHSIVQKEQVDFVSVTQSG
jgi:hypothetical protein